MKKIATEGSSEVHTEYCGNHVYEGNATSTTLQFFSQPEGYVAPGGTQGSYDYVYQYVDHLGNVRLSYTDDNGQLEIVEENNYYPFGLKHQGYKGNVSALGNDVAQRWKFGGKEYQEDMDLAWYDVTARNYDPALGRWMNIDPLAEQMRRHSPYNYAFDNPVFYFDPDGMAPASNGYQELSADEVAAFGIQTSSAILHGNEQKTGKEVVFYGSDMTDVKLVDKGSGNAGGGLGDSKTGNGCPDCPEPNVAEMFEAHLDGMYYITADGSGNFTYYHPDGTIEHSTKDEGTLALQNGADALLFGIPIKLFKLLGLGDDFVKAGKAIEESDDIPVTNEIYKRPNNATTMAQRAAVQGKPCVDCGATGQKNIADHIDILVEEWYRTGTINKTKMRSLNAVQPQCSSCSAKQAKKARAFSMKMRQLIYKRTQK